MSNSNTADDPEASSAAAESAVTAGDLKGKKGRSKGKGDSLYYRVKCKDNGVGMPHDKVGRPREVRPVKGRVTWSSATEALLLQRCRKMRLMAVCVAPTCFPPYGSIAVRYKVRVSAGGTLKLPSYACVR